MTLTSIAQLAVDLSQCGTKYLLRHVDGPVIIDREEDGGTRSSLYVRKLIYYYPCRAIRPTHTIATSLGREVTCYILAHYAEALVRAGAEFKVLPQTLGPHFVPVLEVPQICRHVREQEHETRLESRNRSVSA